MQCSPGGLAVKSLFISADSISRLYAAGALARRPGASQQTGGLPAQHVGQVAELLPVLRVSAGASGWWWARTRPKRDRGRPKRRTPWPRRREDRFHHLGAAASARFGPRLHSGVPVGGVGQAAAVRIYCINRCLVSGRAFLWAAAHASLWVTFATPPAAYDTAYFSTPAMAVGAAATAARIMHTSSNVV